MARPARSPRPSGVALKPEQRIAISMMCAAGHTAREICETVGCGADAVTRWRHEISGEEWDRIREEQRNNLLGAATPILFDTYRLLAQKLGTATVRELVGVAKVIGERIAIMGGVGHIERIDNGSTDELEALLAQAEAKRQQNAIEEALATGSLEPLRAFAPEKEKEVCDV